MKGKVRKMVKTPEDVFEVIKKECTFDGVLTPDNKNDVLDPLKDCADFAEIDWTYDDGISKLVLIFHNLDFVIKIPYTGEINSYCNDHCYNCEACSPTHCNNCSYNDDSYEDNENTYQDFCNADYNNKKLDRVWDYCEAEMWLYQEAKKNGVEVCFAETRLLGFVDGHPIYTQPKAQIYWDYYTSTRKSHTDKERANTQEACKRIDGWCFNVDWLTDFLLAFGDEMFQNFMAFIKTYGIRDLHSANVGYVDGVPVLVDYSGYEC